MVGDEAPWIEERRRDVAELRLRALEAIAATAEPAAAERAARELVEAAPFRESGHRLLMSALAAGGNVAEALRAYEDLRVRLREELGAAPGPELQALHTELLTARPRPKRPDERKLVTIVCAEPGGTLADPEDLRAAHARLREVFEGFGAVHDPPLAVFGVPATHEDDPERAVRAALQACELGLAARAGVATGEAIVSGGAATGAVTTPAERLQRAAARGRDAGRRGHGPRHPRRARLRVLSPRLVGPRDGAPAARAAAAGRPRVRTGGARVPVRAGRRRAPAAPGDRRRPRGDRQEPAGGRVRRRPSRPLPAVRRRHHVLGAAGDPRPRGADHARRQRGGRGGQAAGARRDAGRRRGRARHVRAGRQRRHRAGRAGARGAVARDGGGRDRAGLAAAAERAGARGRRDRGPALGRATAARSGRGDRRPLRRPAPAGRDRASGTGRGPAGLGLPAGDVADRAPAVE